MPCPNGDPACPGPYLATSCDKCEQMEGEKCVSQNPKAGCKGPFNNPCAVCKRLAGTFTKEDYEKMKVQRSSTKKWIKDELKLGSVVLESLYKQTCNLSPAQIDQKYQVAARARVTDCPWVEIGRLYTTVTTGNDAGWVDLVKRLYKSGERRFSIFTGRHGTTQGTLTASDDSDLFCDKVPDANHLLQDILNKVCVEKDYAAKPDDCPKIKLWNVGTTAGTTMTKTQRLAVERLMKGEIVVFAWCWSILSPYKVSATSPAARYHVFEMNQPYNKPIKEIVSEKYGWVALAKRLRDAGLESYASQWKEKDGWRKAVSTDRKVVEKVLQQFKGSDDDLTVELMKHTHHI